MADNVPFPTEYAEMHVISYPMFEALDRDVKYIICEMVRLKRWMDRNPDLPTFIDREKILDTCHEMEKMLNAVISNIICPRCGFESGKTVSCTCWEGDR